MRPTTSLWVVALSLVATAVAAYAAGSLLISPAHTSIPKAPPGIDTVSFDSRNGNIKGWFAPVAHPRGSIVLLHGIRSNRTQMLERIRLAQGWHLSALAIDMQGHGESDGSVITFGYLESFDALAAVNFVRSRSGAPVFVVGVSMGGAAALLADPPLHVKGMILESVYPDISKAISNRLAMRVPFGEWATPLFSMQIEPRLGIRTADLSPSEAAKGISVPVLMLNGSEDRHTTLDDAKLLFEPLAGPKDLAVIEGAAHVDLHAYDPELYSSLVGAFIERYLPHDDADLIDAAD